VGFFGAVENRSCLKNSSATKPDPMRLVWPPGIKMRKPPAKVMALLKTPSLPTKTRCPSMPDARKIGDKKSLF